MDKTEFMERLRKAAELQAAKKAEQQERAKALIEKLKTMAEKAKENIEEK